MDMMMTQERGDRERERVLGDSDKRRDDDIKKEIAGVCFLKAGSASAIRTDPTCLQSLQAIKLPPRFT